MRTISQRNADGYCRIYSLRRCAESWHDGRFVLEQETNAYAVAAGEPVARLRLEEAVLRGTLAGTEAAARAINARTAVASGRRPQCESRSALSL